MKVISRKKQHRRDLIIDLKCENCNHIAENINAYDDRNFWDNVVPSFQCNKCGKSSFDLKTKIEPMFTKYHECFQI